MEAKVKALGVAVRTEDDLKRKWKDLKSPVLDALRVLKGEWRTAKQLNYLHMVI